MTFFIEVFKCNFAVLQTAAEVILKRVLQKRRRKKMTQGQDKVKRRAGVSSSESTTKRSHGSERGSRIFSPRLTTQHNSYSTAGQQGGVSGKTSGRVEEKRAAIVEPLAPFQENHGFSQFGQLWVLETTTAAKLWEQHT